MDLMDTMLEVIGEYDNKPYIIDEDIDSFIFDVCIETFLHSRHIDKKDMINEAVVSTFKYFSSGKIYSMLEELNFHESKLSKALNDTDATTYSSFKDFIYKISETMAYLRYMENRDLISVYFFTKATQATIFNIQDRLHKLNTSAAKTAIIQDFKNVVNKKLDNILTSDQIDMTDVHNFFTQLP